jgi:hypothetical protein
MAAIMPNLQWFAECVPDAFKYLSSMGMGPPRIEVHEFDAKAQYLGKDVGVEVIYEPMANLLATSLLLLRGGVLPVRRAVRIDLNLLRSLDDTGGQLGPDEIALVRDRDSLADVLSHEASSLEPFIDAVLKGKGEYAKRARIALKDVPGDPQLDWWVAD